MPDDAPALYILTPVWGASYVRRFFDLTARAWLAPGNLPALAARFRIRIRLLCAANDVALARAHPVFDALAAHADILLIPIDDVISHTAMPVTLTLAYHRGLALEVRADAPSRFLLLNADFLLADGALRAAAEALDQSPIVLAPSLRVIEEEAAPILKAAIARGALALAPRALARIALDALHPTVLASRVDQRLISSAAPHQLYWRPDADTLLARPFCLFVLGLEIKGPVPPARAFCDYSMAPAMAPNALPAVLGDSDRFLAVELGPLAQETHSILRAAPTPAAVAARLTPWTTGFLRAQADHLIICRAADPGPAEAGARARLDAFLAEVRARLGPPAPEQDQLGWRNAVISWRRGRGEAPDPPELAPPPADLPPQPLPRWLRRAARTLLVGANRPCFWQPFSRLDHAVRHALKDTGVGDASAGQMFGVLEMLNYAPHFDGTGAALLVLDLARPEATADLVQTARASLGPGARLVVAAQSSEGEPLGPLALWRLMALIDPWAEIEPAAALDLTGDCAAARAHGRLADQATLARPLAAFGLIADSLGALLMASIAAAAHALGAQPARPTALVLRGRVRP